MKKSIKVAAAVTTVAVAITVGLVTRAGAASTSIPLQPGDNVVSCPTTTPPPSPSPSPSVTPTPTPTSTPPPVPPPFPDASSTGVPAGVTLVASGSITANTAGQIIEAKNITGSIQVNANNVTIQNSRITTKAYAAINIPKSVTGTIIRNNDIYGSGTAGSPNSSALQGAATVTANDISGFENGLVPQSNSVIQENYLHGFSAPGSPHYDGVQMDGGLTNIKVLHNTIAIDQGQVSAVMIDNYFGAINDITVDRNKLSGGGYTIYSDGSFNNGAVTGIRITNNVLGKGYWGYAVLRQSTNVTSGNTDLVTGAPVALQ